MFIDLFKNKDTGHNAALQELIDEKRSEGHPMEFSALHLAACNSSTEGIRHVGTSLCFYNNSCDWRSCPSLEVASNLPGRPKDSSNLF